MSENVGSARAEDKNEQQQKSGNRHRRRHQQKKKPQDASLNMAELRELADLIDEHGFTDFEFENENIRVRLSKNPAPQIVQAFQPMPGITPSAIAHSAPAMEAKAEAMSEEGVAESESSLHQIVSPIVGTFYRSPAPDKDPYVSEGSKVSPETTVCIVEAMKLMNEIQAEVSGEIVKIYVENGQPVEYNQPLFGVKL